MSGDRICLGAITGSYGIRGEVRLKSFCADPEDVAAYGPVTTDAGQLLEITLTGEIKEGFSARLSGISRKEAADALKGQRLYAPRDRLPAPDEDEFYHADLVGLAVYDTAGTRLGTVKAVLSHGASDLLELHLTGRRETALMPFTRAIVPEVDLSAGRLTADPPEGLLPE